MRRRLLKALTAKKNRGFMLDFVPSLFLMLAAAILVYAFLGCFELLIVNEEIKQVVRSNTLVLETKGYMSAQDLAQMETDIRSYVGQSATVYVSLQKNPPTGAIPLTGNSVAMTDSTNSAGYGECMYLTVTTVIPGEELSNAAHDIIRMVFLDHDYTATVTRMTTAKY